MPPQVPVRAGSFDQIVGFVNADWFGWSQIRRSGGKHWDLYAQPAGGAKLRINPPGTDAFGGGISGNTILYTAATAKGSFDLKLFDLTTRTTTDLSQLNTRQSDEDVPWMSGDWILFQRWHRSSTRVLLFNRVTGRLLQLAAANGRPSPAGGQPLTSVQPDQVNGDYATWTRFTPSHADVFLYRISTATIMRLPAPPHYSQEWPAVTETGTVYVGRGTGFSHACPSNVSIVRITPGQGSRVLGPVGRRLDVGRMIATPNGQATDLYFDRINCRTGAEHIYKLTDRG